MQHFLLTVLFIFSSCALVEEIKQMDTNTNLFSKEGTRKRLLNRGELKSERVAEVESFIVLREGKTFTKYRLYEVEGGLEGKIENHRFEKMSVYDSSIDTCFRYMEQEPIQISCDKLKRDQDIGPFIQ